VEYDLDLLEYSIDYYKGLGVDELFYVLNTIDADSPNLKKALRILDKHPDIHRDIWIGDFYAVWKKEWKEKIVKGHVGDNDWLITIDTDEFYDFPIGLRELIGVCETKGHHCVVGQFVERISEDYTLPDIDDSRSLWEQYPISSREHVKDHITVDKVLLRKGYIPLSPGHHFPNIELDTNLFYPAILDVHHFRWRGCLIDKLEDRSRVWKEFTNLDVSHLEKFIDYYKKKGTML
jgi:hypothetical protein